MQYENDRIWPKEGYNYLLFLFMIIICLSIWLSVCKFTKISKMTGIIVSELSGKLCTGSMHVLSSFEDEEGNIYPQEKIFTPKFYLIRYIK